MSFLSTYKVISNKLNSIAKAMDEKVDTFVDQALSVVEDYDADFFSKSEDPEKDRSDMKNALKKLFSIFEQEKKKVNGYIHFTTENREDCAKRNPSLSPTEITSALAAEWKALDKEEKDEWNKRAKSVSPQTSEEKRVKRSSSKKPSKEKVTCDFSGCDKVVKNPTQHTDGCTYCATHFKKIVADEKKADEKKPEKKSESKKPEPSKTPVLKSTSLSPSSLSFDFKKEKPVDFSSNPDWWICKGIKLDGVTQSRLHPKTGLVLDLKKPVLIGTYINSKPTKSLDDIPEIIKKWCKKSGIEVKEEELDEE